jgi:hypothetical protein
MERERARASAMKREREEVGGCHALGGGGGFGGVGGGAGAYCCDAVLDAVHAGGGRWNKQLGTQFTCFTTGS